MQQIIHNAQIIRGRLRQPPNAVPDRPIDLARGRRGITGYEAAWIAAERERTRERERLMAEVEAKAEMLREAAMKAAFPLPVALVGITLDSPARIRDVILEVCRQWPIDPFAMVSKQRTQNVIVPRHLAMALAKKLTLRSLPEIGRNFGGKDHTTVLHAVRKLEWLVDELTTEVPYGSSLSMWVACAKEKVTQNRKGNQNVQQR